MMVITYITKGLLIISTIILAASYLTLPWQLYLALVCVIFFSLCFLIRPTLGLYFLIIVVSIIGSRIGFISTEASWPKNMVIPFYTIILLGVFLFIWVIKEAKINDQIDYHNPLNLPVFILAAYSLLTFLWSKEISYNLMVLAILFTNIIIFYFIFFMMNNKHRHKTCLYFFIASGGVVAVLTVIAIMVHPHYEILEALWGNYQFTILWDAQVRLRGYAFEQPNFTSLTLNLAISVTLGMLLVTKKRSSKILFSILIIFMIFANCLTSSKAGLGSLLIMGFFIICFSSSLRKKLFLNISIFVVGLLILWFTSIEFASLFGDPKHSEFSLNVIDTYSARNRLEIWKDGFSTLDKKDLFLTGLGIGGFEYYTNRAWAHNLFLAFFFDFGVMGFLFVLSVLITCWKLLSKFRGTLIIQETYIQKMVIVFLGGLIAICVQSIVDFNYRQSILWLYLALTLSTFKLASREQNQTLNEKNCFI